MLLTLKKKYFLFVLYYVCRKTVCVQPLSDKGWEVSFRVLPAPVSVVGQKDLAPLQMERWWGTAAPSPQLRT